MWSGRKYIPFQKRTLAGNAHPTVFLVVFSVKLNQIQSLWPLNRIQTSFETARKFANMSKLDRPTSAGKCNTRNQNRYHKCFPFFRVDWFHHRHNEGYEINKVKWKEINGLKIQDHQMSSWKFTKLWFHSTLTRSSGQNPLFRWKTVEGAQIVFWTRHVLISSYKICSWFENWTSGLVVVER